MVKQISILAVLLCSVITYAQETTSSPYSYFGVGLPKFSGTAENRSMGGLSIASDSIHLNLQNPAGYGKLNLTTYTIGATHNRTTVESSEAEDKVSSTSIDYLAVGIPTGKLGFGFGLIPFSSVGYELQNTTEDTYSEFSGRGGLNKLFLSAGYQITDNVRAGVEGNYNFGNIQNKNIVFQEGIQYGTREENRSDLSGFKVNFGLQYEGMLTKKLQLTGSASYSPATDLTSKNTRELATITMTSAREELVSDIRDIDLEDTDLTLPSNFRIGAGIGQPRKWFAGVEYQALSTSEYSNRSFSIDNVSFEDSQTYRLGGYYIPNYNDITSYFERIVYRVGFRYQETGININNEAINEFGISFGAGLPAGKFLTNINLGVEYGQRGTTAAGLIQENFFNVFISLSLNDRWFQQRKFN